MKDIVLLSMIALAIVTINVSSLRKAVIFLSVFSLVSSFAYVLLGAPDVALAEAVMGVSLSTVLYLVAIKKFRVFRVYYHSKFDDPDYLPISHHDRNEVERYMDDYLKGKEIEIDIINTSETTTEIREKYDYDLIISHKNDKIKIYGERSNYLYDGLVDYLIKNKVSHIEYEYLLEKGQSLEDLESPESREV